MVVFRVQLNIHNWIICQLDVYETECLTPPDFCQGLHMLEVQNNRMLLPTVTNVPALLALRVTTRVLTLAELEHLVVLQEEYLAVVELELEA
jgi:hypothetical protein